MKRLGILLKVTTTNYNGETALDVWKNGGKHAILKRPFDPYFYNPRMLNVGINDLVTKRRLSTMALEQMYKVRFSNVNTLKTFRVDSGMENEVPYDQRVAIDLPNGFKTADDTMPSIDAFDLEIESKRGYYPNADTDRITAISYFGKNFAACKTIHEMAEDELLSWFVKTFRTRNPDMPATYWGSFADWNWLIKRAKINNVPLNVGRDSRPPYVKVRTFTTGKKTGEDVIIDLGGRVHFDVWKEVDADQTIFGIKNKQLKTVARWFGLKDVIEVDRMAMAKLNADELHDYCLSDARLTYQLAEIYVRNLIELGEYLKIPMNMVVERNPSHVSNYIYMRRFKDLGIVSDKNNQERFPEFVQEGRKGYQGALINLFRAGVYRGNLRKADFKSMYPSIMICFNYSPESIYDVHIHSGEHLAEWVDIKDNKISVSDDYLGIITVKVDLTKDSVSRAILKDFMSWRNAVKKEMQAAKRNGLDATEFESRQWAIKVMMNAIPGYNGMGFARCGSFPIAAHICGHGRHWVTIGTHVLDGLGDVTIERDTDGIYYASDDDHSSDITESILEVIPDVYDKSVIAVEDEQFSGGIFYEDKGYVLFEKSGKLKFHGSGLKGRHIPNICDKGLELIAKAIFAKENVNDILNDFGRTIKGEPESNFIMTAELKKKPDEYADSNQYGKLIQKMRVEGIKLRWGDEIQYIKTTNYGYMPLGISGKKLFTDYNYYYGRVADVVERLLRVSHGYNQKQIVTALKGGKITPHVSAKESKLEEFS